MKATSERVGIEVGSVRCDGNEGFVVERGGGASNSDDGGEFGLGWPFEREELGMSNS